MSDENYIDKLYKDAFKSYEVQPKKELDLKDKHQLVNTSQKISFLGKIAGSKLLLTLVIAGSIALITGVVLLFNSKEESPADVQKFDEPSPVIKEEPVIIEQEAKTDSMPVEQHIRQAEKERTILPSISKNAPANNSKIDSSSFPKPVIIHKTIIKHDTVIEHKKVIQEMPGNEK
jgi:hypothetical protein